MPIYWGGGGGSGAVRQHSFQQQECHHGNRATGHLPHACQPITEKKLCVYLPQNMGGKEKKQASEKATQSKANDDAPANLLGNSPNH